MLDPTDKTFVDSVAKNGTKPATLTKSLNANNYAMYALASYGRQCNVPAAAAAALAAWNSWDASSWKGGAVGYDDTAKGGQSSRLLAGHGGYRLLPAFRLAASASFPSVICCGRQLGAAQSATVSLGGGGLAGGAVGVG
jgi:hypothetical protein